MGNIALKRKKLVRALDALFRGVLAFNKIRKTEAKVDLISNEEFYQICRDSLIKRFEFSLDLFWQYPKIFLEEDMKVKIDFNTPKGVIRLACKSKVVSEQDAEIMVYMIDDRNISSHIYKEEIADRISLHIEDYYNLMKTYLDKLVSNA